MARDYKHIAKDHTRRKQSPPWVWLLVGLSIGLFVAFLVYLGEQETRNIAATPSKESRSDSMHAAQEKTPERELHELKEKEEQPEKPKFEFYTILPEMEVQVPEHEVKSSPRSEAGETNHSLHKSVDRTAYVLQVGSFRRHQDADRLKAELALIGLRADIQVVSIGGEDTWHRVRLGPYKDLRILDETRDRLSEHNLQAIVLKEKD